MNREDRMERRTAPGHAWVCSAAIVSETAAVTLHRAYAGLPGNEKFAPCRFRSTDFEEAHEHADVYAGSHWVYEHPNGDINQPPRRSMHGSDGGGAYIDPVIDGEWRPDDVLRGNLKESPWA